MSCMLVLLNITRCVCVLQLLAGAEINAHTNDKQTSLHLAASKDHSVICTILLENGVDFDALDENGDNGGFTSIFELEKN